MIEKITEEEIAGVRVARLADRPNENSRYGGSVMSADELKAAEAAQILAIVYDTTGISPENVSIISK